MDGMAPCDPGFLLLLVGNLMPGNMQRSPLGEVKVPQCHIPGPPGAGAACLLSLPIAYVLLLSGRRSLLFFFPVPCFCLRLCSPLSEAESAWSAPGPAWRLSPSITSPLGSLSCPSGWGFSFLCARTRPPDCVNLSVQAFLFSNPFSGLGHSLS